MSTNERAAFGLEFRVANEGDGRTIRGIAAPYDQITHLAPSPTGELFKPGAFAKSIGEIIGKRKIKLFRSHDYSRAVGVVTEFEDTPTGLGFEARIAKTAFGDETLEEINEGTLDSVSVGFRAIRTRAGINKVREVIEAAIEELSLAPMPAYAGARISEIREADVTPPAPVVIDLAKYKLPPMPKIDPKTGLSVVRYSL